MLLSIWQSFHLSSWCLNLWLHFVHGSPLQFSLVLCISQSIFKTSMPKVSPLPIQFSSINFFKMSSSQQPSTLILRCSFKHQLFNSLSAICILYPRKIFTLFLILCSIYIKYNMLCWGLHSNCQNISPFLTTSKFKGSPNMTILTP